MSRFLCDLAWTHLSLRPHGHSTVCCIADHSTLASQARTKGKTLSINTSTITDIINSDTYCDIRLKMLAGEVPSPCRGCKTVEDAGGISKRMCEGSKKGVDYDLVTDSAGKIPIDLHSVEIQLGNLCNLKCRSCNAESSTSWITDYHALKNIIRLPSDYDVLLADPKSSIEWSSSDRFFNDLTSSSPSLREIHLSGGEPFLVPKHSSIIDNLIETGRTNVTIHYNSNLNYNFDKLIPLLTKLTKFKRCDIDFSIDDVDERNSYIRKLSDWDLTISNLRRFLAEFPTIRYNVTQTISAYNFLYVEELYQFLLTNNCLPYGGVLLNHVQQPDYLNPLVLPIEVRQRKLDSLFGKLPANMIELLKGRYYYSDSNGLLDEFKNVCIEVDKLRGESLSDNFPALARVIGLDK